MIGIYVLGGGYKYKYKFGQVGYYDWNLCVRGGGELAA